MARDDDHPQRMKCERMPKKKREKSGNESCRLCKSNLESGEIEKIGGRKPVRKLIGEKEVKKRENDTKSTRSNVSRSIL